MHLICGRSMRRRFTFEAMNNVESNHSTTIKQYRRVRDALDSFWKDWSQDYLTQLREHRKPLNIKRLDPNKVIRRSSYERATSTKIVLKDGKMSSEIDGRKRFVNTNGSNQVHNKRKRENCQSPNQFVAPYGNVWLGPCHERDSMKLKIKNIIIYIILFLIYWLNFALLLFLFLFFFL